MAKLTAKSRNKLPSSKFGEPGKRAYPMPDKAHAANAKARATQQVKAGNLSPSTKAKIDAKADRVLNTGRHMPANSTVASRQPKVKPPVKSGPPRKS